MERYLLFIRDVGKQDHTDIHSSEPDARKALVAYVRYQREQLDRASTFSDTWQRALWQTPDIDYRPDTRAI